MIMKKNTIIIIVTIGVVLILGGVMTGVLLGVKHDATIQCVDANGNVIANAEIRVTESRKDITSIYTTDAQGKFKLKRIKPGKLTLCLINGENTIKVQQKITRKELISGNIVFIFE